MKFSIFLFSITLCAYTHAADRAMRVKSYLPHCSNIRLAFDQLKIGSQYLRFSSRSRQDVYDLLTSLVAPAGKTGDKSYKIIFFSNDEITVQVKKNAGTEPNIIITDDTIRKNITILESYLGVDNTPQRVFKLLAQSSDRVAILYNNDATLAGLLQADEYSIDKNLSIGIKAYE